MNIPHMQPADCKLGVTSGRRCPNVILHIADALPVRIDSSCNETYELPYQVGWFK
jgi:hypothetical protein